ncbi:hypothetical protein SFRURICE_019725 [Spodoptera frugiperda]|uniref:SFRICE_014157 n=1 Tax=Spodoptera frugiperda TaxID=7108 RepID=A0A2H1V4M6_SPOFR|nr:hypothetical protein SFRURICE_019725 [Spodoptera frugiperda]
MYFAALSELQTQLSDVSSSVAQKRSEDLTNAMNSMEELMDYLQQRGTNNMEELQAKAKETQENIIKALNDSSLTEDVKNQLNDALDALQTLPSSDMSVNIDGSASTSTT